LHLKYWTRKIILKQFYFHHPSWFVSGTRRSHNPGEVMVPVKTVPGASDVVAEEKSIGIGSKVKRCWWWPKEKRKPDRTCKRQQQVLAIIVADYFIYNIVTLTSNHFPSVICQDRTCEGRDKSTDKGYFRLLHLKYWTRKNHSSFTSIIPVGLSLAAEAIFFLSFDCYPNYPGW